MPQKFVKKCAEFTKQEIKIIKPKVVICLGSKSFFGLTRSKRKHVCIDETLYFHQYHPAARVSKQKNAGIMVTNEGVNKFHLISIVCFDVYEVNTFVRFIFARKRKAERMIKETVQ